MDVVNAILEEENNLANKLVIEKPIDLQIDEGTLLVSDSNAFDTAELSSKKEEYLKSLSRDNVQMLINKIWSLPTERIDEVIVAKLPPPKYIVPRARIIPKGKTLTKWEQFAKEKGIKKNKKKSKLKWDDELQKWIPTFGYKKAKAEEQKDWIIELGDDNKPKADPRETMSKAKEERVAKNELQRLRNLAKSKNIKVPKVGVSSVEHGVSAKQLNIAATVARVSTASVGKFQSKLPKEKDVSETPKDIPGLAKKRKGQPLSTIAEKKRNIDLIDKVTSKKNSKDLLRVDIPTVSRSKSEDKTKKSKSGKKPKSGKGRVGKSSKKGGGGGRKRR